MTSYYNNGKKYLVESVVDNLLINVNGTTITDWKVMSNTQGYTVFVEGDEDFFETFEEAYDFAMNGQKDTIRLER